MLPGQILQKTGLAIPPLPTDQSESHNWWRLRMPSWLRLILSNPKALAGVILLTAFLFLVIFGPLIWPGNPNATDYTVRPQLSPSARHSRAGCHQGAPLCVRA